MGEKDTAITRLNTEVSKMKTWQQEKFIDVSTHTLDE